MQFGDDAPLGGRGQIGRLMTWRAGLFGLDLELGGQLFDFELEGFVLGPLALEDAGGEVGLGGNAFRGEQGRRVR